MEPTRRAIVAGATAAMMSAMADGAVDRDGKQPDAAPANTNDAGNLTPRTEFDGPALQFDFPKLLIGCAEYDEGPTGCTVFHFPDSALAVADMRGGAHASIFTDYLRDGSGGYVDAICLAGGSCYGLEAATGVSAELLARRNYSNAWRDIAGVSGAIIYDFRERNSIYPDKTLGRAALRAARPGRFPLGRRGAGRSATCGKWPHPDVRHEPAGQGAAFKQIGKTKLAVFTVVNSVGAILDRKGNVVRGMLSPSTGQRRRAVGLMNDAATQPAPAVPPPPGNTTLTMLVTNRKLDGFTLRQIARQVHSSMSRAIDPFHTLTDGDILFAASTGELADDVPNAAALGVMASELAWDAVLNCYGG